ncbi:MAG: DegT/DnrJ/EryC1/StrS family aminotransferase [Thermodesulfobacteriota bacterium]|nr:DegT/DnrJ/EryC1/StrS family aminotransferase [Thermodesulfobacteriota bacterium]
MVIPLVELKKQYRSIEKEINSAIMQVLQDTNFVLGHQVEKLEKEVSKYCNARYAVGVASGTDALVLSLVACDIGRGDEVITTPFTFIATAEAIIRVGAKPVFCDIDEVTYNISLERIKEKITPSTKALLLVHLYGLPCDMDEILSLAKEYNLKVVEDCAQAFGAEYRDNRVGSLGDVGCFSFFPSKNLGAYGDGGMVVTSDETIAQKISLLRNHGSRTSYYYSAHGFNSRLDTLQAAILLVKLNYVDEWIKMRRKNAAFYNKLLAHDDIITPTVPDYMYHCFNYYTVRLKKNRDLVQQNLTSHGVAHAVYYPLCLHLQEIYKDIGYKPGDFPVAEKMQDEVLSLPMYAELAYEEIEEIGKVIIQSMVLKREGKNA